LNPPLKVDEMVRKREIETVNLSELLAFRDGRERFSVCTGSTEVDVEMGESFGRLLLRRRKSECLDGMTFSPQETTLVGRPWAFGGQRWFMLCPLTGCLTMTLYRPVGAHRFASRRAHGLKYPTERMDAIQRSHARIARAYARIGGMYRSLDDVVPERPKGMRTVTYQRLLESIVFQKDRHLRDAQCRLARRRKSGLSATIRYLQNWEPGQ
jgi:hypothetical protein